MVVGLGAGVLAPDVQHEHSSDEHQGTNKHRQWTPEEKFIDLIRYVQQVKYNNK